MKKPLVSLFLGIILGLIADHMVSQAMLTLIMWGFGAVIIGYWSSNKLEALKNGLIYGFFLGFIFMIFGYSGIDPVVTKLLPFAALGLLSAVCATILSLIALFIKKYIPRK